MDSEFPRARQPNGSLGLIAEEVAEIRQILMTRVSQLKSFIQEAEDSAATEAQRIEEIRKGFEATVAALESKIEEKEAVLQKENSALRDMEGNLTGRIFDLESRVKEKEQLLAARDAELAQLQSKIDALRLPPQNLITLREEDAVPVREAAEQEVVATRVGSQKNETGNDNERLAEEVQRLKAEMKEKDVLLEAREMEVKMIKQSMDKRIRELESIVKRQAREGEKKSRLVSFIGTIEKRN
ncbi:MAG: hypothetical protein AAB154_08970 [Candidatus Binatota bacterium]